MNIGEFSVQNRVISWLLVVIMVGGGIMAFGEIGRLEDPSFTIKAAKVITRYPGATAREVQDELTYHLEDAIQKMPQVKRIKMSVSRPGLSDILIDFKDEYKAAINGWSLACQVMNNGKEWNDFYNLTKRQDLLTYALLKEFDPYI